MSSNNIVGAATGDAIRINTSFANNSGGYKHTIAGAAGGSGYVGNNFSCTFHNSTATSYFPPITTEDAWERISMVFDYSNAPFTRVSYRWTLPDRKDQKDTGLSANSVYHFDGFMMEEYDPVAHGTVWGQHTPSPYIVAGMSHSNVISWFDQSPNKHHVYANTEGGFYAPQYIASAVNGKPAVRFSSNSVNNESNNYIYNSIGGTKSQTDVTAGTIRSKPPTSGLQSKITSNSSYGCSGGTLANPSLARPVSNTWTIMAVVKTNLSINATSYDATLSPTFINSGYANNSDASINAISGGTAFGTLNLGYNVVGQTGALQSHVVNSSFGVASVNTSHVATFDSLSSPTTNSTFRIVGVSVGAGVYDITETLIDDSGDALIIRFDLATGSDEPYIKSDLAVNLVAGDTILITNITNGSIPTPVRVVRTVGTPGNFFIQIESLNGSDLATWSGLVGTFTEFVTVKVERYTPADPLNFHIDGRRFANSEVNNVNNASPHTGMSAFSQNNYVTSIGKWRPANTSALNASVAEVYPYGTRDWDGDIAEILVFNEKLANVNISKVEGYLAHKYGLQENLKHKDDDGNGSPEIEKYRWEFANTADGWEFYDNSGITSGLPAVAWAWEPGEANGAIHVTAPGSSYGMAMRINTAVQIDGSAYDKFAIRFNSVVPPTTTGYGRLIYTNSDGIITTLTSKELGDTAVKATGWHEHYIDLSGQSTWVGNKITKLTYLFDQDNDGGQQYHIDWVYVSGNNHPHPYRYTAPPSLGANSWNLNY